MQVLSSGSMHICLKMIVSKFEENRIIFRGPPKRSKFLWFWRRLIQILCLSRLHLCNLYHWPVVIFLEHLIFKNWLFFRNLPNLHFYKTYCKILHILKLETFFWKQVWIWSTCTSIDASFNPEVKYGFKFHLGQMVLS